MRKTVMLAATVALLAFSPKSAHAYVMARGAR